MNDKLLSDIENYYSGKIREHGISAKGVDWNSEDSQNLRFLQLIKVIAEQDKDFSVLDYGCGYGAIIEMLQQKSSSMKYTGFDISQEMLDRGKQMFGENNNRVWINKLEDQKFDYTVASGIFNVRLEHNDEHWLEYIHKTLTDMNSRSVKGFSFNMLTKYSDKEYMRDYLYYADPAYFLDYCKKNFSKYVAIMHDYPLYEFTVLVRKNV